MNNDLAPFFFFLDKNFHPRLCAPFGWRRIASPISPTVVCECEMLVIKLHSRGVYWVAPRSMQKSLELGRVELEWHCAPSTLSHESPRSPKEGAP